MQLSLQNGLSAPSVAAFYVRTVRDLKSYFGCDNESSAHFLDSFHVKNASVPLSVREGSVVVPAARNKEGNALCSDHSSAKAFGRT